MNNKTLAVLMLATLLAISCTAMVTYDSDQSDGAQSYTARVFTDVDGSVVEYSGTGATVKDIIVNAMSTDHTIDVYPNGSIKSVDGNEASSGTSWVVFQWLPLEGWSIVLLNSSGNTNLDSGTSYFVKLSTVTTVGSNTTYSEPSYEPMSKAYFFIKFVTDVNANSQVTSVLTESQRSSGFWIWGEGSDAAEAFSDACSRFGFQLNMNNNDGDYLKGWLGSFLGLEDVQLSSTEWNNWSQFDWTGSSWKYSDCLGHYDAGVSPYHAIVRQVTLEDSASSSAPSPSTIPSSLKNNSCTVKFVDGDGNVIKTQNVSYFGSATAPSTATKTSSDGTAYTFSGWDTEFSQVIGDLTVTAKFTSSGGSGGNPSSDTKITGVKITGSLSSMNVGNSSAFSATVMPTDAGNKKVTWSSSNDSVLTVDSNGKVTAISKGVATITVTSSDGGFTDSASVTVSETVKTIKIGVSGGIMSVGDVLNIAAVSTSDENIVWSSSDNSVMTVSDGKLTAKSAGSVTITASAGTLNASCSFLVVNNGNSIDVVVDGSSDVATIVISSETVKKIKGNASAILTVTTSVGSMEIPNVVLNSISKDSENLTIDIRSVDNDKLTADQRNKVRDSAVYSLDAMSGSSDIHQLGGSVKVTLPYTLRSGEGQNDVKLYYLDSTTGSITEVPCIYDAVSKTVSFETDHFSYYVVSASLGGDSGSDSIIMIAIATGIVIVIIALMAVIYVVRHRSA